jgi:membrane protein DedA with SNARE-associated domain
MIHIAFLINRFSVRSENGITIIIQWSAIAPTMLDGVTRIVLDLVETYGFLIIFAFMFLETSMLFPFLPSELVVPSAAAALVTSPVTFGGFVLAATAGATVGSLFAYYAFGETSHFALERYGGYIRVSDAEVDRAQHWFHRCGESSVFWARFLPILRSIISIPAGFAEMAVGKFVVYSAGGSFVFIIGVTTLVYYLGISEGLLGFLLSRIWDVILAYPIATVIGSVVTATVAFVGWREYGRI